MLNFSFLKNSISFGDILGLKSFFQKKFSKKKKMSEKLDPNQFVYQLTEVELLDKIYQLETDSYPSDEAASKGKKNQSNKKKKVKSINGCN